MEERQVKIILNGIDNTQKAITGALGGLQRLTSGITGLAVKFTAISYAAKQAYGMIESAIRPAYDAVEDFNGNVFKMAAMITNMAVPSGDLAADYQKAKDYAEALSLKLEDIDAKTVASAAELRTMTEEMMKQGTLLDINNQKQIEGFTNIANAAAVIAQGYGAKEIQIRQEIRSLLQGEVKATNQLAQQLDAMLGGTLKKQVELWKQEETIIENIGSLLRGYAAASTDIEGTWAAIGSTMETISNRILRNGFSPIYKDINQSLLRMNEWFKEHSNILSGKILFAARSLQGVFQTVWNLIKPFGPTLGVAAGVVSKIAEGFGMIAFTILPPMTARIGSFLRSMLDILFTAGNLGAVLWNLASFNFEGAKNSWESTKKWWNEAGKDAGDAFSGGFGDEIATRYRQMLVELKSPGQAEKPEINPSAADPAETKKQEDLQSDLRKKIIQFQISETENKRRMLDQEIADITEKLDQELSLIKNAEQYKKKLLNEEVAELTAKAAGDKNTISQVQEYKKAKIAEIEGETLRIQQDARDKWLKGYLEGVDKAWKAEVENSERLGELATEDSKRYEEEKKLLEARMSAYREMYDTLEKFGYDTYEFRISLIEKEAEAFKEALQGQADAEELISAWRNAKITELNQQRWEQEHEVMNSLRESWGLTWDEINGSTSIIFEEIGEGLSSLTHSVSSMFTNVLMGTQSAEKAAKSLLQSIVSKTIEVLISIGVQKLILAATGATAVAVETAAIVASNAAIASSAAPAAMLESIATYGGAAAAGAAGFAAAIASMQALVATMTAASAATGGLTGSGATAYAAKGGVFDKPTLTWLGEENKPEAVVPLGDNRRSEGMSILQQILPVFGINAGAAQAQETGAAESPTQNIITRAGQAVQTVVNVVMQGAVEPGTTKIEERESDRSEVNSTSSLRVVIERMRSVVETTSNFIKEKIVPVVAPFSATGNEYNINQNSTEQNQNFASPRISSPLQIIKESVQRTFETISNMVSETLSPLQPVLAGGITISPDIGLNEIFSRETKSRAPAIQRIFNEAQSQSPEVIQSTRSELRSLERGSVGVEVHFYGDVKLDADMDTVRRNIGRAVEDALRGAS